MLAMEWSHSLTFDPRSKALCCSGKWTRSLLVSCQLLTGFLISRKCCSFLSSKLRFTDGRSWAFWKRAHRNDAGLNNIQKFHVHDAVNEETLRLIAMALKTYRVPDGDVRRTRLPKWPGLVFDIETDEGKAMLGSPNGMAAGYFRKCQTLVIPQFPS
jgi:hypothetical protein